MAVKALELFDAYAKSQLPNEDGFIISSFFSEHTAYSRFEIVSYSNVKSIYAQDDGLTFHTDGKKMFLLVEPSNYPTKGTEPYVRKTDEQIPLRFNELEIITAKNQTRIMISKKAVMSYGSFTILKPTGINFSLLFYKLPDMYTTMKAFLERTLNKDVQVPSLDAKKSASTTIEYVKELMNWDYT